MCVCVPVLGEGIILSIELFFIYYYYIIIYNQLDIINREKSDQVSQNQTLHRHTHIYVLESRSTQKNQEDHKK